MLLTAFAAGLAPRDTVRPGGETPGERAAALPAGRTLEQRIPAAPGSDSRIRVRRGDVLQLEVAGNELDSVLLERLDRIEAIEPTTPARFKLLVDAPPGVYPIRLVEADRRIGQITVKE